MAGTFLHAFDESGFPDLIDNSTPWPHPGGGQLAKWVIRTAKRETFAEIKTEKRRPSGVHNEHHRVHESRYRRHRDSRDHVVFC
jgi:hypothetical protein